LPRYGGDRYAKNFSCWNQYLAMAFARRIYAGFAQTLMATAHRLYARDPMGVDLEQSLYALESTTIDLCLKLFPWARFILRTTPQSVAVTVGLAPVH
jgi:hypothetical protein